MSETAAVVPELKSATQITAELQGSAGNPDEVQSADPKDSKEYTFDFSHTDPRGKVWTGKFTNRILTVKQRRLMKVTKAQLAGGVPMSALDADIWEMNEMIAHLSVSLVKTAEGFPSWAKDLEELYDEEIITKLYGEVASHEATFHRRKSPAEAGAGVDEDGAG
jgi:hypothetical protein